MANMRRLPLSGSSSFSSSSSSSSNSCCCSAVNPYVDSLAAGWKRWHLQLHLRIAGSCNYWNTLGSRATKVWRNSLECSGVAWSGITDWCRINPLTLMLGGGGWEGVASRQSNLCGTFLRHFSDAERLTLPQNVDFYLRKKSFKLLYMFNNQRRYKPHEIYLTYRSIYNFKVNKYRGACVPNTTFGWVHRSRA